MKPTILLYFHGKNGTSNYFKKSIFKLFDITKKYCIISLPKYGLDFVFTVKLPKIPKSKPVQLFGKNFTFSFTISLPIPVEAQALAIV